MTLFIRWFCHHSSVRGAIYLTFLLKIKDFFFPRFQQTLTSIDANSHSHSTESMCVTLSHFLRHSWICTRESTTFVTNRRNNTRSSREREREQHPVLPHSFPSFSSSFHFVHLAENKIRYSVNWHSWDRMRGKGVSSNRHFALTHSVERLGPLFSLVILHAFIPRFCCFCRSFFLFCVSPSSSSSSSPCISCTFRAWTSCFSLLIFLVVQNYSSFHLLLHDYPVNHLFVSKNGSCSFIELMIHPVLTEQLAYFVALIEWGTNDEIQLQSTRSTMSGSLWCEKSFCYDLSVLSMSEQDSYKTVRAYDLLHQSVIQSSYTKTILVDIFGSIFCQYFALLLLLVSFSCLDSQGRKSTLTESLKPGAEWTQTISLSFQAWLFPSVGDEVITTDVGDGGYTFSRWMLHVSLRGWIEGSKRRSRGGKQEGINEEKPFSDFRLYHDMKCRQSLWQNLCLNPLRTICLMSLFSLPETRLSPPSSHL